MAVDRSFKLLRIQLHNLAIKWGLKHIYYTNIRLFQIIYSQHCDHMDQWQHLSSHGESNHGDSLANRQFHMMSAFQRCEQRAVGAQERDSWTSGDIQEVWPKNQHQSWVGKDSKGLPCGRSHWCGQGEDPTGCFHQLPPSNPKSGGNNRLRTDPASGCWRPLTPHLAWLGLAWFCFVLDLGFLPPDWLETIWQSEGWHVPSYHHHQNASR